MFGDFLFQQTDAAMIIKPIRADLSGASDFYLAGANPNTDCRIPPPRPNVSIGSAQYHSRMHVL